MVLFFFILLIAEIIAFIITKKLMRKNQAKKGFRIMAVIAFLVLFVITLKFVLFPPVKEIPVTGEYKIASEDYWVDEDKADPYLADGTLRQLQVRKWYPLDCNVQRPVIIASHGSCGTIDNNLTLYRELASHGYTVLAPAHSGQTANITYKNGKKAGPSGIFIKQMSGLNPEKDAEKTFLLFKEWMAIRIDDLNAVMDAYLAKEGETKFIVLGHSLGGSAAYAIARVRSDVLACIALESPFMYDVKGVENGTLVFDDSDYKIPLLNIYSDSSYKYLRTWSQYKNNAKFLDSSNKLYTNIYYPGIGHMGLCDLSHVSPVLSCLFSGTGQKVKAAVQLKRINDDCLNWLENTIIK